MINAASFRAAAFVGLAVAVMAPADGFAQSKINEHPNERTFVPIVPPRPPMRPQQGAIVGPIAGPIVAPIGSPQRSAMPLPPSAPMRPFDHDHDRDRDRDNNRGAFAAGVATGIVIGGGMASPPPGTYYVPPPSPFEDPVAYCTYMYSSYDPQSGTYIGDDNKAHPCPP